jgi:hypothetical protein
MRIETIVAETMALTSCLPRAATLVYLIVLLTPSHAFFGSVREILHSSHSAVSTRNTRKDISSKDDDKPNATTKLCETEQHLDYPDCTLEDLKIPALKAICKRVGIDVYEDVFPYLVKEGSSPTHEDFERAAFECLTVEKETHAMLVSGYIPDEYVSGDPRTMANLLVGIIDHNPEIMNELQELMSEQFPELLASFGLETAKALTPDMLASALQMLDSDEVAVSS